MPTTSLTPSTVALVAAGCWVLVSLLVSLLGWARLAGVYRCEERLRGRRLRWQSGGFRWGAGYNFTLTVLVHERGLHLSVLLPLRVGHPPLLIPWSDLSAAVVRAGWVERTELSFRRAPSVRFRITPRLARRLRELAGERWCRPAPAGPEPG